jgi:hypothetical protein
MKPSLCPVCQAITAEALVSDEGHKHVERTEDLWFANQFASKTPVEGKNFRLKVAPDFRARDGTDRLCLLARSDSKRKISRTTYKSMPPGIDKEWIPLISMDVLTLSGESIHFLC